MDASAERKRYVTAAAALDIEDIHHRYGHREALAGMSCVIPEGETFALLGPNGSGKTTLFKILCTLVKPTTGTFRVFGHRPEDNLGEIRKCLGVVFQQPSIDPKLTVRENLLHQGCLYGLRGAELRERLREMLHRFGINDRQRDLVEQLSGGLQRRVELAKACLHRPRLLLLDEPSTGLDPAARHDLITYLEFLRAEYGVTVVLTTHILEDAEHCDRVGILDEGRLVAVGSPQELRERVSADIVVVRSPQPVALQDKLRKRFHCEPALVDGALRIEQPRGHDFVREVVEAFPDDVQSITFGKPTLEDVFVQVTGHRFWMNATPEGSAANSLKET